MISDNEIIELWKPHEVALIKMHVEAIYEMNNGGLSIKTGRLFNRIKSGYINNVILEKAKPYFRGIEGFEIDAKYDSLILICSGFLSKFKKFSKVSYPKPSCVTTRSQNFSQGVLFEQPEFLPKISLEIKYFPNEIWTEIEKLSLIKRVEGQEIEIYQIFIPIELVETIKAKESTITTSEETQITKKAE